MGHIHVPTYSMKFGAIYCESCKKWLERRCGDKKCEFCIKRPRTAKDITPYRG